MFLSVAEYSLALVTREVRFFFFFFFFSLHGCLCGRSVSSGTRSGFPGRTLHCRRGAEMSLQSSSRGWLKLMLFFFFLLITTITKQVSSPGDPVSETTYCHNSLADTLQRSCTLWPPSLTRTSFPLCEVKARRYRWRRLHRAELLHVYVLPLFVYVSDRPIASQHRPQCRTVRSQSLAF